MKCICDTELILVEILYWFNEDEFIGHYKCPNCGHEWERDDDTFDTPAAGRAVPALLCEPEDQDYMSMMDCLMKPCHMSKMPWRFHSTGGSE